jgi:hypothetical protein
MDVPPPIEQLLPRDCLEALSEISTRAYGVRILGESGWPTVEAWFDEQREALRLWREQ